MALYRKILVFVLGLFLFIESPLISMEVEGSGDDREGRNWRNSLDLYNGRAVLRLDQWFSETKESISEGNVKSILKSIRQKPRYLPNLAAARFIILYKKKNDPILKYALWDLQKFFLSGQFDVSNNARIVSAQSFLRKGNLDTSGFNEARSNQINTLFGSSLNSGTCSEASILEYIYNHLTQVMNRIKNHETNNEFEIIGTITQISSLGDPCSQNCIPMLNSYMQKMKNILENKISDTNISGINLSSNLKNIVLLAGRKPHIKSREAIHDNSDPIDLNLGLPPYNIIYSKEND